MKFFSILIVTLFILFTSCVSTKVAEVAAPSKNQTTSVQESKPATLMPADLFLADLDNIDIKVIQNPTSIKTIYKNKPFGAPFIIKVTKNGAPLAAASITVTYPISRDNDVISYATLQIVTGDDGVANFTPEPSAIAVSDFITFYPTPVNSEPDVTQAAFDKAATATFLVKSDVVGMPGGILYVYDYNDKGQLVKENFTLLKHLRNAGVNAGNSPVCDSSYLNRDAYALYKACKPIVTGQANFLIYGTFKYLESHDNEVTLQADVVCLSMTDGRELYKTSVTQSASGSDKRSADIKCRENIGSTLAQDVMYAM